MKTIYSFIIAAVACLAISCSGSSNSSADNTADTVMSVDSLLDNAAAYTDSLVTFEGVCTHTCRHGATKMFLIGSDDSNVIRVEACELGSFKPEVVNNSVTVTGYLRETRVDEDYLTQWEQQLNAAEEQHGENGTGCETERSARGVQSSDVADQIQEYRERIAAKVVEGGDPWLSFYYVEATDYEINQ